MTLQASDKEFRHAGISYMDYKQIEMDRVLTAFLPRLWWEGQPSVLARSADLSIDDFVQTFQEHPDRFADFDNETTYRWLETHLLDVVSRGRPTQAVAGLRPLHGFTYRFRNARRSRPYGADEQLYEMILHARDGRGPSTLNRLREFFFEGVDQRTELPDLGVEVDVETQALISLAQAVREQITDRKASTARRSYPPLFQEASELLADDVLRLLFHQEFIPRSVLVEQLKILFAFHLALYHLKITKLLPAMIRDGRSRPSGGFFLDAVGIAGTPTAKLAERSARVWYGRIPDFVKATFTVRRLEDLAQRLVRRDQLGRPADGFFSVEELLALLEPMYREHRDRYAEARLEAIEPSRPAADEADETVAAIRQLGLDEFTTYIEVITAYRIGFHRKYFTEALDSLLLKNRPGAMIEQPRRGGRRFVLDGRLLEVLVQLALLRPGGSRGFHTERLRIDEFLNDLRVRYGLHIDRLPDGDGFGRTSIVEQAALRANVDAFTARLREIGFYNDLSDAYLTQVIVPRYNVPADAPPVGRVNRRS